MKKNLIIIGAFIMGVVVTICSYQTYLIYQIRSQVGGDHVVLTQVVDFLNQSIQASQNTSASAPQIQAPSVQKAQKVNTTQSVSTATSTKK